jgi:hypothetical protein
MPMRLMRPSGRRACKTRLPKSEKATVVSSNDFAEPLADLASDLNG